jgi:hypothetical protein
MQFLELSVRTVIRHSVFIIVIRLPHCRVYWTAASHSGVSIRPLVHITALTDFVSCTISHIRHDLRVSASREGGALVLNDLLKYIIEDFLGVIGVRD